MSFWYGLSFADICQMPLSAIEAYLEKLEARKTDAKLMLAEVIVLPHLKKEDRTSALNGWMRLLSVHHTAKTASPLQLQNMGVKVTKIAKKHVGVQYDPK